MSTPARGSSDDRTENETRLLKPHGVKASAFACNRCRRRKVGTIGSRSSHSMLYPVIPSVFFKLISHSLPPAKMRCSPTDVYTMPTAQCRLHIPYKARAGRARGQISENGRIDYTFISSAE